MNPALALTWLYPGCAVVWRNFFNLITHCFPAPCNLQLWSKLFNLNSSGPKFLQLHLQHSTQVFVQCVTVSSVLNPSLHIVFDPFPSRVKINKLLHYSSLHPSRVSTQICSAFLPYNTLLELYWNVIKIENWIKKKIRFLFYSEISKMFPSSFSGNCRLNKEVLSCLFRKTVGQDTLGTLENLNVLKALVPLHNECWESGVEHNVLLLHIWGRKLDVDCQR